MLQLGLGAVRAAVGVVFLLLQVVLRTEVVDDAGQGLQLLPLQLLVRGHISITQVQ